MKIKMKTLAAGPNGVFLAGNTYASPTDLSDEHAQALVQGGYADVVKERVNVVESASDEVIETADVPVEPIEMAVKASPKKGKAK